MFGWAEWFLQSFFVNLVKVNGISKLIFPLDFGLILEAESFPASRWCISLVDPFNTSANYFPLESPNPLGQQLLPFTIYSVNSIQLYPFQTTKSKTQGTRNEPKANFPKCKSNSFRLMTSSPTHHWKSWTIERSLPDEQFLLFQNIVYKRNPNGASHFRKANCANLLAVYLRWIISSRLALSGERGDCWICTRECFYW